MPYIHKPKKDRNRRNELKRRERTKIYNSQRWRDLRAWKMLNDTLCEECSRQGRVKAAEDVHHIVSFMSTDDPVRRNRIAYDYNNLMSVCKECHAKRPGQ